MAMLLINNITILNNPAPVTSPFHFKVYFESFGLLPGTLYWRVIYLGSPEKSSEDQTIEQFEMDNIHPGVQAFQMEAKAPDFSRISPNQILDTTAIIISVKYENQEFFRCGYYVRNEYEQGIEPPRNIDLSLLRREIRAANPCIMRMEIEWAKREGEVYEDTQLYQQNIAALGSDPFQTSNGAFEQLAQIDFRAGMFGNGMM